MKNLFSKSLRSKKIAFGITIAAVFVAVISLVIFEGSKNTVTLSVNGEQEEIITRANTVEELLVDRKIEVSKHDIVTPSKDTLITDGLDIQWEQAKQIAIKIDKEETSLWTTKSAVSEVLAEAGIELAEHDKISPALTEVLGEENEITISKAYEFMLVDAGEEYNYWSTVTTVGDFLTKEEIVLDEFDRLSDALETEIQPGAVVEIVRVVKETEAVEEEETFTVETKSDDTLLKGQEEIVQEGENGTISREYEIVKENGEEVSRMLIAETQVKEPTNQVISIGTKVVIADAGVTPTKETVANTAPEPVATPEPTPEPETTVSRDDSAPAGGEEFYVTATAYTAGCTGCSGITATGINLLANPHLKVIAVDPSVIPLGSKVWVEDYGYAIAGDTGGAIKGNKIDLHMPTKDEAYSFGRRQVKMKIIN